jgi:hypothetical protein
VNLIGRCAASKPELQDGSSALGVVLPIDRIERAQARRLKDSSIWIDRRKLPGIGRTSDEDEGFVKASKAARLNHAHTIEAIWGQRREGSFAELAEIQRVSNERPDGIVRRPVPGKASQDGKSDGENYQEKRVDGSASCWLDRGNGLCAGCHAPEPLDAGAPWNVR